MEEEVEQGCQPVANEEKTCSYENPSTGKRRLAVRDLQRRRDQARFHREI